MPHLKFRRLLVISNSTKSANQFQFQRLNLITADDNSVGKSTLIKLLMWGFGCEPEFDKTWTSLDCSTIITFEIGNRNFQIKRYQNSISVKEGDTVSIYNKIGGQYSQEIADLLQFKALLPNQKTGELEVPPPAYYFLPFYIDQKRSWSKAWENFNNLGQYRAWKKTIIKYHVGLLTPEYFDLELEKSIKKNNKSILNLEVQKIDSTLEIVDTYLPSSIITTLTKTDFENLTDEIEKDLKGLTERQEEVLDKYSSLQNLKSHLQHQKLMALKLIDEFDRDYMFAVENIQEDDIKCPLCGTVFENSILNKTAILRDKGQAAIQLEQIQAEISSTDKKLERVAVELGEINNKIDYLNQKYSNQDSEKLNSFKSLVENIGGNSLKAAVKLSKNEKVGNIKDLDTAIRLASKSQKKLYTKEYIEDINADFCSFLSKYIKSLDAEAINLSEIQSPLSYKAIEKEGGAAENSRAILAYYIAIFSLVAKYKNEIVAPLLIDTPNQQEQSSINYINIVNLILNQIPNNNQIFVCAMANSALAPLESKANIIKLNKSKLLDNEQYHEIKKLFDTWN